jgi:hypothetical protein
MFGATAAPMMDPSECRQQQQQQQQCPAWAGTLEHPRRLSGA